MINFKPVGDQIFCFRVQDISADNYFILNEVGRTGAFFDHGNTGNRPSLDASNIGYQFFDINLGKPIYYNGSGWVDATGTTV